MLVVTGAILFYGLKITFLNLFVFLINLLYFQNRKMRPEMHNYMIRHDCFNFQVFSSPEMTVKIIHLPLFT